MITFQVETYDEIVPDMKGLVENHWKEIGSYDPAAIPLDPDWEVYKLLDTNGSLRCIAARENGKLVGYAIFLLCVNLHYSGITTADSDIIFLLPEYRKGFTGYHMIRYAVNYLKSQTFKGKRVGTIGLSMKTEHAFEAIAERLNFKPLDIKYIMEV